MLSSAPERSQVCVKVLQELELRSERPSLHGCPFSLLEEAGRLLREGLKASAYVTGCGQTQVPIREEVTYAALLLPARMFWKRNGQQLRARVRSGTAWRSDIASRVVVECCVSQAQPGHDGILVAER